MSKILVGVHLDRERVGKLDRLAKGNGITAETTRAKQAAFMLARALDAVDEGRDTPRCDARREHAVYAGPDPDTSAVAIEREPTEGARLRAARVAAKFTQPQLAAALSSESAVVSRDMVQRAERAASLDEWPALRAWLIEREACRRQN